MKLVNIIFLMLFLACGQNSKNKNIKNESMNVKYMLNYEIPYPAEVLINDMIAEIDLENGIFSPCNLNTYLVNKKEQVLKIRIYPNLENGEMLNPEVIDIINEELAIYKYTFHNDKILKMDMVKKINFPKIKQAVPFIEYEWSFETDLSFKNITNLDNSQDLTKIEQKELEDEVVLKYDELRNILNRGDGNKFMKEIELSNNDFFITNYFLNEQKNDFNNNQIKAYNNLKDNMLPIDSFRVRILGNGKLVSLERISKYKGQGVLMGKDKENKKLYLNYVMLHIPNNTKEFKIFKINSFIQGYE